MGSYVSRPYYESPLLQFLDGYFHPDWRLDDPDQDSVIQGFLAAGDPAALVADIDLVLTEYPEDTRLRDVVASHLVDVGLSDMDPPDWLRWLRGRLISPDQDSSLSRV